MSYNELVKILLLHGFRLRSEKGAIRVYEKTGWPRLVRVDYHGAKEIAKGTLHKILKDAGIKGEGR